MKRVIYAVYGSNLLKERFMVYIKGGYYEGKLYDGCRDKEDPIERGFMFVPYRLYFSKQSSRWDNKGVAFLSCKKERNKDYHAVVRLWEITEEQFNYIWTQEGKGWYNQKLSLNEKDGLEIYTITGCWLEEKNIPSERYIKIISKGIKETTNWNDKEVEKYLSKFIGG